MQVPEDSKLDAAALKLANTRNPHFTPDVEGDYELQFTVQVGDSEEAYASSKVILQVTNENLPPVVVADDNATVAIGKTAPSGARAPSIPTATSSPMTGLWCRPRTAAK